MIFLKSLPLVLSTLAVASATSSPHNCPKSTDSCYFGYKKFSFSDPKAPQCWEQSYGAWYCYPKSYGKCNSYRNQIDIGTCKEPPKPQPKCPLATDYCLIGLGAVKASSPHAPPCWAKGNNGWTCLSKQNGACRANEVDVSTCKITIPITPPTCPKASDFCVNGDIGYPATSPSAPPCWAKEEGKFLCFYKSGGKCDASKGEIDIGTCNIIPPTPVCPPKGSVCYDSYGKKHNVDGYDTPKCWKKSDYGYNCRDTYNNCNSDEIDVTKCKY